MSRLRIVLNLRVATAALQATKKGPGPFKPGPSSTYSFFSGNTAENTFQASAMASSAQNFWFSA